MQDFESLKRIPVFRKIAIMEVFIRLSFEEGRAYVEVVDRKGKPVDANYQDYQGKLRELLKAIEKIRSQKDQQMSWFGDSHLVFLDEHSYLVWLLRDCPEFIDREDQTLVFLKEKGRIEFKLSRGLEGAFSGEITLKISDLEPLVLENGSQLLTETHAIRGSQIIELENLGENYLLLNNFNGDFQEKDFEKCTSLFYTYFPDVSMNYNDFREVIGDSVKSIPSLYLEKVDEEECLFFSVFESLKEVEDPFLLRDYEINRWVRVNEMEREVLVSELEGCDIHSVRSGIRASLNKYVKKNKKSHYFKETEDVFILNKELAALFIYNILPELLHDFRVIGSEKLKTFKVRPVAPRLSVDLSSGIDFIGGSATVDIEGETFSLFDFLKQYQKESYIVLKDGTRALVNEKYLERLRRIFRPGKKKGEVEVSFFDLPFVEELLLEKAEGDAWKRSRDFYEDYNKYADKKLKLTKVKAKLRSYQKNGVQWLQYLEKFNLGGCLADDMGLGKTLQAISLLTFSYPKLKTPSLLIMPRSLLFNWEQELTKFSPQLTYYIYHGQNRDLKKARKAHLILTTYGTIRSSIDDFRKQNFHYVILDESQNIKNVQAKSSKAVMLLKSKNRLALSGTPVENNLSELYSLFRFLNPGMFGSEQDFNQKYLLPIHRNNDKEATADLRRKIKPFILRRLKKDVLDDLPPRVEQHLYVEMGEEQAKLYEERQAYYYQLIKGHIKTEGINKSQFMLFQALTELRQIATVPEVKSNDRIVSPKRELLVNQMMDAISNQHKCLIFVNFLSALEHLSEEFREKGVPCLTMSGSTNNRQEIVEKFQNDSNVKVLIMTLKTGGVGLNLTSADMVYIYDPWWNVAAENQAIDRTHRIGQKKTVFCYKLVTKGTIEERILELQEQKKALFDNIIGGDSSSVKTLTETDVDFILGE